MINGKRRAEYEKDLVLFIRDIRKHLGQTEAAHRHRPVSRPEWLPGVLSGVSLAKPEA